MSNTGNLPGEDPRYEIRLAGSGGQGIILAGIILAEAAILEGKYVAQIQNYGPEVRGGNSVSEVIISGNEIDYPQVLEVDLLVALTQEACDQHLLDMKEDGLVIIDSDLVQRVLWRKLASLPLRQIAQKAGKERAINMAALGAVASFCPRVSAPSLLKVMTKRLPKDLVAVNRLAFEETLKAASNLRGSLNFIETKEEFEI